MEMPVLIIAAVFLLALSATVLIIISKAKSFLTNVVVPLILTLIMAFIVFFIIDLMYLIGTTKTIWETSFKPPDAINYAGVTLAFLGTFFLGLLVLYKDRKIQGRETKRDDDITIRDTYAFLTPTYVFVFRKSFSNDFLKMERFGKTYPNEEEGILVFQLKMKASREFAIIKDAKITNLSFTFDKKHFYSNDLYKKTLHC